MTEYKATTINGEPHIQAMNPYAFTNEWIKHEEFVQANPPILWIDSAIPDGTLLDESEVDIGWEMYDDNSGYKEWIKSSNPDRDRENGYITRRVATLKADTCFIDPSVDYTFSYDPKNCTGTYTPKAKEGEQGREEALKIQAYIAGRYGYPHFRSLLVRADHEMREKAITDCMIRYAQLRSTTPQEPVEQEESTLAKSLTDYINQKHTQEECTGFIDGYNTALRNNKP